MSIYGGSKSFDQLTPFLDHTTLGSSDVLAIRDVSVGITNLLATKGMTVDEINTYLATMSGALLTALNGKAKTPHTHTLTIRYPLFCSFAGSFSDTTTRGITWGSGGTTSYQGSMILTQVPMTVAGTLKNIRANLSANSMSGGVNFTVYKGQSISNITCTLNNGVLTGSDLTHTLSCNAGDTTAIEIAGSGSGTYSNFGISAEYEVVLTSSNDQ